MLPEDRRPQRRHEEFLALEFLAGADGEGVATREASSLESHGRLRCRLDRHQASTGTSRGSRKHDGFGGFQLRVGLPALMLTEVEFVGVFDDRVPCQVSSNGVVEILHPRLVGREKHQGVAKQPRTVAARFQQRLRRDLRRTGAVLRERVLCGSTTSRASWSSGTSSVLRAKGWTRAKSPGLPRVLADAFVEFGVHLIGFALQLLGPIIG